jgi:biopolymer transport protein ExbD
MASVDSEAGETLSLNIMPMLDIFSILILFLLMSFSTDPVNHDITAGLEMPDSVSLRSLDEIPKITVTRDSLRYQDKKIADIDPKTGDFFEKFKTQGAVKPLFDELEKLAEANKKRKKLSSAEEQKDKPQTDALTMEMDKRNKFVLMRRVMKSAQQAEFIAFKLMVAKTSE